MASALDAVPRVEVKAAHDQTVKCDIEDEEELDDADAMLNVEDDDEGDYPPSVLEEEGAYTNQRANLHPAKASLIGREPEGEPEFNRGAAQPKPMPSKPKAEARGQRLLEQDDPPEDEKERQYSIGEEEGSLNISESNDDSLHEVKQVTTIPILKNNDKFKSKTAKEAPHDSAALGKFGQRGGKSSELVPFSQRVNLADPYNIAF